MGAKSRIQETKKDMSRKVRITSDAALQIVCGIFEDEEVNVEITDESAPKEWQGKKLGDVLNVEYYTFKHRPIAPNDIISKILAGNGEADKLAALKQSYCLFSLDNIERLYTKDADVAVLEATLQYYVQTDKIKLLEYLIEDSNIAVSGYRIPVQFETEMRKAVVFFGRPKMAELHTVSQFGEMAHINIDVAILLHPDIASYSDYNVKVSFTDNNGVTYSDVQVPLTSFTFVDTMTQDAVPYMSNRQKVGSINLSSATSFVLVFEGYNNPFINYITDKALNANLQYNDNNQLFTLTIERAGKTYMHEVVVKDHQTTTNADTGNETHTLSFVTRGLSNGN